MPKPNRVIMEEAIELIEKRSGMLFPKATEEELAKNNIVPLLLTIDPLNVVSRPLLWYFFVKLANLLIMKWYEYCHGLKYGKFRSFE